MLVFKARPRKSPNLADEVTPSQRRIIQLLTRAVDRVQDSINLRELEDLIEHRSAQQVANRITVDPWIDIQRDLTEELLVELIDAGRRVKLPKIQKATLTYRFDADRPEARAWAEKEAGNLIVEITEEQRAVVRGIVGRSQSGEFTVAQVARQVRGSIGLTERQAGWVENFRQRQIDAATARGIPAEQAATVVQSSVDRYHKRIHRYRSETIARTETIRASSEGRQQAWQQGIDEGFISPNAMKQWIVEFDGCQICQGNGALGQIPLKDEFPTGEPPAHPNCRCDVILVDEPVDEFTTMTDEELADAINDLINEPPAQEDLSLDDQIARLEAEREPIRQQLVAADFGEIELTPEEYRRLVDEHKPIFEELMALKQQKLEAERAPTIRPTREGEDAYARLAETRQYDDQQREAFQQWQGDGYRSVQGALYGEGSLRGMDPDTRMIIDGLDSAMQRVETDTVLYRGQTRGLEELQVGQEYSTGSYVSTSTDPVTAGAFSKSAGQVTGALREGDTPTIMRITPKRASGAVVPSSSEYEVVLARKTPMTVTGITEEEIQGVKFRIIDMEA